MATFEYLHDHQMNTPSQVLKAISRLVLLMIFFKTTQRLGGGFKHFLFLPLFGEDEPILTIIFFKGVGEKPPRSEDLHNLNRC